MDVMCCKSVGTDLTMLDIDDFITEISQLKKEVALLEAKLRSRGDEGLKREDVVCCKSSVYVTDDGRSSVDSDSVLMSRDQSRTPQPLLDSKLSEEKSRHTQDSELSLTLLCYTQDTTVCDSNQGLQDEESTDQASTESLDSVCNAGEQQQIQQTTLKMCSVKLIDCRNLMMEMRTETEEHHTEKKDSHDDDDFIPSDEKSDSCSDGETSSTSKERLTCITCGKTLSSQRHLERHERKHIEQKLFTCRCKISFTTLQEKKLHSKEHAKKKQKPEQKQFHCEQCGKSFFFSSSLKKHMKTHSDEKLFHCSECDKYFSSKGNLVAHKRIHTGEKRYKCPYCEKRFHRASQIKPHVRLHTKERPYQCSECGKTFTQLYCLKEHKITQHEGKPYQCLHCDKRFGQKSSLIIHGRIHTGEKPFLCSHCGKSFTDSTTFRVHQRVHTGEKPYHCNVCNRSFGRSDVLSKHQRTHTGERLYKCSQCEKTFARLDGLKTHERVHTGEKPYHCSICGERFAYSGSLQVHQKKHAEELC